MKRFKNILLVSDFDTKQHLAVERAVSLTQQNDAQLTVLNVVKEFPSNFDSAFTGIPAKKLLDFIVKERESQLDELSRILSNMSVEAETKIVTGTPFIEIIRQVLRDQHDLVILAAEGEGGITERLFGSTSMHLIRKCPCPVWVVKPSNQSTYRKVMAAVDVTVDFPDDEEYERSSLNPFIMQLASSLSRIDKSEFHMVQVWSIYEEGYMQIRGNVSDESLKEMREENKQHYVSQLDRLQNRIDLDGIACHRHLPRSDNPADAIIKLTKKESIDMLVMGTVCRTGLAGFFIGNTAEKVLSEVNCSVLTVKPEGFVTPVELEDD